MMPLPIMTDLPSISTAAQSYPRSPDLPTKSKPNKIGFSIASIVGDGRDKSPNSPTLMNPNLPEKGREFSSETSSSLSYLQKHNQFLHHHLLNTESGNKKESMSPPIPMLLPNHHPLHQPRLPLAHHLSSPPPGSNRSPANYSPGRVSPADNTNTSITSRGNGKEGCSNASSRSSSPGESPKDVPASPHEIHRPLVSVSQGSPRSIPGNCPPSHLPMGTHALPQFAGYPGMLNFAAMAAAAAAQNHHPTPHPGIPPAWLPSGHSVVPHHPPGGATAHPLFPWLLTRQSRFFPPRFGPGPDLPGFLFQPFRKPKRIRTAFSPSQLLKLEHAFEKNHYVVGAERKQLAKSLSLSETQVKVWFQNRRTKHKRVESEDDPVKRCDGSRGNGSSSSSDHPGGLSADSSTSNRNYEMSDEEDLIMDDEYSDEDGNPEMERHSSSTSMHHHLHKSYS